MGTYVFGDETITRVKETLLMAEVDDEAEGIECFIIEIVEADTTAADAIGAIDTAEVCVLEKPDLGNKFIVQIYNTSNKMFCSKH